MSAIKVREIDDLVNDEHYPSEILASVSSDEHVVWPLPSSISTCFLVKRI